MKKKNTEVKRRHYFIINLAKLLLTPVIKIKYRYSYKKYKDLKNKGPFIVLGNHTVAWDPIIMSHSFPFHLYYFASEQIFNLGFLSKMLLFAANPIKKSKSVSDMAAIRKARKIVNEGGSIGIYPEGNVSYDGNLVNINESIVKLIRLLKIPVIFFITKGLYSSDPRWSVNMKKGKSSGEINKILYPDEYNALSDEELYNYILANLRNDEFNTDITFKGKEMAKGLERLVFLDLNTNKPFTTFSKDNKLYSSDSNFELTYLNDSHVIDQDDNKFSLPEINEKVIKGYIDYYMKNDSFSLKRNVEVINTTKLSNESFGTNLVSIEKDKFVVSGNVEQIINFDSVSAVAVQGKRKVIVYFEDKTWMFAFDDLTSPYIYILTYQIYKERENIKNGDFSIHKFGL